MGELPSRLRAGEPRGEHPSTHESRVPHGSAERAAAGAAAAAGVEHGRRRSACAMGPALRRSCAGDHIPALWGDDMPDTATTGHRETDDTALRTTALVMATLGFAVNFWAWSLLSPLGPVFVADGIADDAAVIVAVPVLVGSLGRIVVGGLTDRFGGRLMMPAVSLISVVPVLFIGFVGQSTHAPPIWRGFRPGAGR